MNLEHLEKLKSISKCLDRELYFEIYKSIYNLGLDCVSTFEIPPENTFVFRSIPRVEDTYSKKSQISYNPNPEKYNRASRPGQKVFYGTLQIPEPLHAFVPSLYEALEITDKPFKKNETNVLKLIVGAWKLNKKVPTIPIFYNHETLGKLKILEPLFDNYKNTERPHNLKILEFISDEFTKITHKSPLEYQISAAFSEYWFINTHYKSAILFPTVRYSSGVNIAIPADRVAEYLTLSHVWTTDVYYNENAICTDFLEHTDNIDKQGNFTLKKSKDKESNQGKEKCIEKLKEITSKNINIRICSL